MDIEIFTLCDAAAEYNGRLNIMGVFDTIFAAQLPARHPFCSVAVRIRFQMVEAGQHRLTLHIVDFDGNMIMPAVEGAFIVEMPAGSQIAYTNLVLNLGLVEFHRFGEHAINLAIDGRQEGTLPFWIREPQRAA